MKIQKIISSAFALAAAAALLAGCGGDNGNNARPAPAQGSQANTGAIVITGNDQMQFSMKDFTVKAGTEVTITFRNIGRMPKEAMGHNFVVLTVGTDPMAFATAAMRHPRNEYVPPEMEDRVVAHTKVLGPGEEETITFTAPAELGDYPFVCSFPGHTPAGMRGIMKVE
jgi:azurin